MNDDLKEQFKMIDNSKEESNEEEVFSTRVPIDEATANEEAVSTSDSLVRQIFFHKPIKYIVSFIIGLVVIVITMFVKGPKYLISYVDGTFIAGFVLIAVGFLSILTSKGSMDIFSYSTKYVYNKFRNKEVEKYHEYSSNKMEKREKYKFSYVPYFVNGAFYFVISLILLIILE